MSYGVPYKGSKNSIAEKIIRVLPSAENFYDLFAGGCAITHAALLFGKWKNLYVNDIDGGGERLFRDAVEGKFKDEKRWISREDFFRLKDSEPYVKFCWSFGNGGKSYLYGRKIEERKRELHFARVLRDKANEDPSLRLQSLERLQSLKSLERLQGLQGLQGIRINYSFNDYTQVKIKEHSIVYCDIPYKNTNKYFNEFDHDKFYAWALENENPIFISEYGMPDSFHKIFSVQKRRSFSAQNNSVYKIENLYANDAACELYAQTILL